MQDSAFFFRTGSGPGVKNFLLHSTFFKGKVKSGILVGFIVLFKWA